MNISSVLASLKAHSVFTAISHCGAFVTHEHHTSIYVPDLCYCKFSLADGQFKECHPCLGLKSPQQIAVIQMGILFQWKGERSNGKSYPD